MSTSQRQDVIRCHLCENPVEFNCNLCNIGLCGSCVLKHMSDKSRKHEVVEFKNRKANLVYPECKSHGSKCEAYCHGCKVPVCITCVIKLHKDHDVEKLDGIVTRQKDAIESGTKKLRAKVKWLQMHEENIAKSDEKFDKVTTDITQREIEFQGMVHNVAEKMRKEVAKKKEENRAVNADNKSVISDEKHKLQHAIESNGELLRSQNILDFLNYRDTSADLTTNIKLTVNLNPSMIGNKIQQDQIRDLFGYLTFPQTVKHLIDKPEVLVTIPSQQKPLWRLMCAGIDEIWTSGEGTNIRQIDRHGNDLQTIAIEKAISLSVDGQQCLVFSKWNSSDVKVYKNGNEVVVVKASGGLRFKYQGNLSNQSKYTEFEPSNIAADVNHHILISDHTNDVVHVIDRDGNFIRYIEYPCTGGLSIDADHDLVVGDIASGEIKIIKYLE